MTDYIQAGAMMATTVSLLVWVVKAQQRQVEKMQRRSDIQTDRMFLTLERLIEDQTRVSGELRSSIEASNETMIRHSEAISHLTHAIDELRGDTRALKKEFTK